jgi:hypothetical protein
MAASAFGGWLGAKLAITKSFYLNICLVATLGLLTMYSSIKISFR